MTIVMKSESLILQEPSGPIQACTEITLFFTLRSKKEHCVEITAFCVYRRLKVYWIF